MKISDLQKWANWPAQAGSKKWAENQETCRFKRNFPISKKLAELTTKKLTSGSNLSPSSVKGYRTEWKPESKEQVAWGSRYLPSFLPSEALIDHNAETDGLKLLARKASRERQGMPRKEWKER